MKKKLLALALFAVMIFTLIPIANASSASLAYFAVKGTTTQDIVTKKTGTTYEATVEASDLALTYADKYDATGAAYYGVYIPVFDTIKPLIGVDGVTITLNGDKVTAANFDADQDYYYVGYADMAKGFNRTFTWVATNGGQTVNVKYTVKLNVKAADAPKATGDLAYNFAGSGDGWAITTKNGAICLDIAADYFSYTRARETPFTATVKLTVGGKSPIPAGSWGYLSFDFTGSELPLVVNSTYDAEQKGYPFKSDSTIKVTFPALCGYADGNDELSFPITDTMTIKVDTKATDYLVKGVRYIIRTVEVGDPHGIYFVDGDVKNVGVGDVFSLALAGKEATLMQTTKLLEYDVSNNIIYKDGDEFVAVGAGTVYVTARYRHDYKTYTDTIKVVVTDTPATTQYYVVCRALNIRKGPGTSYSKAGLFYRNDVVNVVSVSNGWAKIWYKSATYYVSFKYLAKV